MRARNEVPPVSDAGAAAVAGAGRIRGLFRPAYLQLTQTTPDRYEVLWKVPALDETTTLKVRPEFPDGTIVLQPTQSSYAGGTVVQHWRIAARRARRQANRVRRPVRNWN